MDDKEFSERSQAELARIEAVVEQVAANGADIDFETQSGTLELSCFDESKIIISPHAIAKELWVAARSGGFHFRYEVASGCWLDTRTGEALSSRLEAILKQQGQIQVNLA